MALGPYPGMNPYLESSRLWSDFHHELISSIRFLLRARLPKGFTARVEERLYILNTISRPDITLLRRSTTIPATGNVAVLEAPVNAEIDAPLRVQAYRETVREAFVEIVSVNDPGSVITLIEVLSPANKRVRGGREEYIRKQEEILDSTTHLLEIDLLRAGLHTVAVPIGDLREESATWDYLVSLHRAGAGGNFEIWPLTVEDRLPRISVPLSEGLADIPLDLQEAAERAWSAGGYEDSIDYTKPPE